MLQLAAGYHVFTFAELVKDGICFHGLLHFLEAEVRRPTLVLDSFDSIFFCHARQFLPRNWIQFSSNVVTQVGEAWRVPARGANEEWEYEGPGDNFIIWAKSEHRLDDVLPARDGRFEKVRPATWSNPILDQTPPAHLGFSRARHHPRWFCPV